MPYYKVIVMPEKQAIAYDGKRLSLENGMKAQSTLFLEKKEDLSMDAVAVLRHETQRDGASQ